MSVFEYGTERVDESDPEASDLADIISSMQVIDDDVEDVSVVDQGTGQYSYLRNGIPNRFAEELEIAGGDRLLMKRVGDALIVRKQ